MNLYSSDIDIPSGLNYVRDNEAFFDMSTARKLNVSCEFILSAIDGASYDSSSRSILDRFGMHIYSSNLSTGCKTALNIFYNVDCCFSLVECGGNAIDVIYSLSQGNALADAMNLFKLPTTIDVTYDKHHITNRAELGKLYEEVWPDAYSPDRNYL